MGFVTKAEQGGVPAKSPGAMPSGDSSVPKQSVFSKIGSFAGEVGKEILRAPVRALATPFATAYQDITELTTGKRPESVSVPLVGEIGISNDPQKALGQLGGRALDVALLATGAGAAKATLKTGAKVAAEQGVKAGVKAAAKTGVKQAAKTALLDAGVGAAYGGTAALAEGERSPEEIAKAAAIGAGVGVVAPPVVGGLLRAGGRVTRAVARTAGEQIEKAAGRLERIAAGEDAGKIAEEIAGETAGKAKRFYQDVDRDVKPSFGQKAADVTAKAIRAVQKAPGRFMEQFDRYHQVGKFEERLKAEGIAPPDLGEAVQGARYRGLGRAENRLEDYIGMRQAYGDDWRNVKEYAHYLDDLDRLAAGQKIAGGRTADDVKEDLAHLLSSLKPEQAVAVEQGHRQLQKFLNTELLEAVEAGRLNPDQYQLIKEAHPNYIPHDVLDYLDEGAAAAGKGMGRSFQLTKSGIEKAKGSVREIDDIDRSVTRRLLRQSLLNEKNKVNLAVMDTVKGAEEKFGFVPLRTAANVRTRSDYYKGLADLRDDIATHLRLAQDLKGVDKTVVQELKRLDEMLGRQESRFFADLAALGPEVGEAEANRLKLLRESDLAERQKALRDFSYDSFEKEDAYQRFKKAATRRPWMTDLATDEGVLKKRLKDMNLDREFFEGAGEQTNDEILRDFQKRFITERRAPKPDLRFVRKMASLEKTLTKSERRLEEVALKKAETEADRAALTSSVDELKKRAGDLTEIRKDVHEQLRNLADIKIKGIDIPEGFEKFSFFRDGVREDWLIPEDLGRAMKAMNGEEASKAMSFLNNTIIGKVITAPAKLTRAITTQKNPIFALFRNPLRDIQTAQITGDLSPRDWARGLSLAIGASKGEADQIYRLARESGALQGGIYREHQEAERILAKKIAGIGKDGAGFGSKVVGGVGKVLTGEAVEAAGQVMEEATRLGVFSRALKNGLEPREAAKLARNATVDFGKSGPVLEVLNKVIPFLNARAQGFLNLGRAIKDDPTRAARKLFYTAAWPTALLTAHNLKYDSYANIPDYEKKSFWIVMVGQTAGKDFKGNDVSIPYYIKIPKGEAQMAIAGLMERMLTAGASKYPESTGKFLGSLAKSVSPVTESSVLPPGLAQWVELKSNYSFFRETQIEPEYTKIGNKWFKTDEIEPEFRAKWNTSEAAKALGEMMGWSPTQIDYVVKTGLMNDLVRLGDLTVEGWSKESVTPYQKAAEIPFLRSILGTASYGEDQAQKDFEKQQTIDRNTEKILKLRGAAGAGAAPEEKLPAGASASGFSRFITK